MATVSNGLFGGSLLGALSAQQAAMQQALSQPMPQAFGGLGGLGSLPQLQPFVGINDPREIQRFNGEKVTEPVMTFYKALKTEIKDWLKITI